MKSRFENSAGERSALLAARELFQGAARAASRNRKQKIAFAILTLFIAVAGVALARFLVTPVPIVFLTGPEGSLDNVFAIRLKEAAKYSRRISITVSPQENILTVGQHVRQYPGAVVVARSSLRFPSRMRAIAKIDRLSLIIAVPKGAKAKTLAALKGKRLAIIGKNPADASFVRQFLSNYDYPAGTPLEERTAEEWPKLFEPNGPAAVFWLARKSEISTERFWPNHAQKPNFELVEPEGVKGLLARMRGTHPETIDAGLLIPSPKIPDEDVATVGLDELLLSRARLSNAAASELASIVIENRDQLGEAGRFAMAIEPPDTDKDVAVLAHPGAAEYVDDDTKTFVDRYSDLIYLGLSLASVAGTIFLGLYSTVTRVSPVRAGQMTDSVLTLGERATAAATMEDLVAIEKELNEILSLVLAGLRDGSIAHDGFEAFRLVFDVAREAVATQKNVIVARGGDPHLVA